MNANDYRYPVAGNLTVGGDPLPSFRSMVTERTNWTVSSKKTYVITERLSSDSLDTTWEVYREGSVGPQAELNSKDDAISWIKKQYQLDDTKPEVIPPSHFFEKDGDA